MTKRKRVLVCGAAIVAALVAIEVVARLYHAATQGNAVARINVEAAAPTQQHGRWAAKGARRHPFEAFMFGNDRDERNSYPPYPGGNETFLIGLFGSTVAMDVAPALKRAVAERFSLLGVSVEPVVLNLAKDGGRQPQQLMVAISRLVYGAHFDVLINLDGLDEMNWRRDSTLDHYPRSSTATMPELLLLSEIATLREQQASLAEPQSRLGVSAAFSLFVGSDHDRLERNVRQLEEELALLSVRYSLERDGPRREWTADLQLAAAARQWFRSSMLLAKLAEAIGADYYHLLQPSRHVPGSKKLSEERNWDFGEEAAGDHPFLAMYPMLVELGRDLTAQGIAFFDLTKVFADSDEAPYKDICCRLTPHGNALLAASVLRHIAPSVAAAGNAGAGDDAGGRIPLGGGESGVADRLLATAHYDVYARGLKRLVYKRDACVDADVQAPFFLDVVPLPDESAESSIEQVAFDFSGNVGVQVGRRCIVEQRLPDFPIASLRTGQRNATTREPLWLTQVQFSEFPTVLRVRAPENPPNTLIP